MIMSNGGRGRPDSGLPIPVGVLRDSDLKRSPIVEAVDLSRIKKTTIERVGDDSPILDFIRKDVNAWRLLADNMGYYDDVAWLVPDGLTLEDAVNANLFTKNRENVRGVQTGEELLPLVDEPPTDGSIVLWIPELLKGSDSKTADVQNQLLRGMSQEIRLSPDRVPSFGSVTLLSHLLMNHQRECGGEIPLPKGAYVRTDTLDKDNHRVCIGGRADNGLQWFVGDRDDKATFGLGCYMTLTLPGPSFK